MYDPNKRPPLSSASIPSNILNEFSPFVIRVRLPQIKSNVGNIFFSPLLSRQNMTALAVSPTRTPQSVSAELFLPFFPRVRIRRRKFSNFFFCSTIFFLSSFFSFLFLPFFFKPSKVLIFGC